MVDNTPDPIAAYLSYFMPKVLFEMWANNPLNQLAVLLKGSQGKFVIFSQDQATSVYNPELPSNSMKGITVSPLDIPATYTGSLEPIYEGKFRLYNQTNKPRWVDYEVFHQLSRIEGFDGVEPIRKWQPIPVLVQGTRRVELGPNGMKEVEFLYPAPPTPAIPQYYDVNAIMVMVAMEDDQGGKAQLQDISHAV